MIPKLNNYYYIDYEDLEAPDSSFIGVAKCVAIHNRDEGGRPLARPLYEFIHPDKKGNMVSQVYYSSEILLDALKP